MGSPYTAQEDEKMKYDFVISRAVTVFHGFVRMTAKNVDRTGMNRLRNGILCLKGGDLSVELDQFHNKAIVWNIKDFFDEPYFETKKIVYLPF